VKSKAYVEAYDRTRAVCDAILAKVSLILVLSFIISWAHGKWFAPADDTDLSAETRSGFRLLTDYGTGRQYLLKDGVMIPRLDADGNPVISTPPTHD
jgi:hypothetical protein